MKMQNDTALLTEFEDKFQEINDGKIPRPDGFGYNRVARQLHKLETQIVYMHRALAKNPRVPLPSEPETLYEKWIREREDREDAALFGDIFMASPEAFGNNGSFKSSAN